MYEVTVVIPAFGAATTLPAALASVAGQASVIVVLDGPDPAAEAVLSAHDDVEVIRLPVRAGAPTARNLGLSRVRTQYVLFLDADDYIEGPLLAAASDVGRADDADIVLGRFVFELPDGQRTLGDQPYLNQDMGWRGIIKCWLTDRFTPPCAVLWKAPFLRDLGGWDETLLKNQDGDLIHRAMFENPRISATTKGLGVYVQHDRAGRISAQSDLGHLESQFQVLEKIYVRSDPALSHWRAELGPAYARIARFAFERNLSDIEGRALARARSLGCGPETGTRRSPPSGKVNGVYINLDRATERRADIEAEVSRVPRIRYRRFAAIDGRELSARPDVRSPAELGCFMSHMEAIRSNIGSDHWLHVLEDDARISRFADEAIGLITTNADFDRYDIIFTNLMLKIPIGTFAALRGMFDRCVVTSPSGDVETVKTIEAVGLSSADFVLATSYLVNPRSTERVADLLSRHLESEPFEPVDVVLSRLSRERKLSMSCILPFLTMPRIAAASTILETPDTLSIPLRLAEAAFYADRDMAELRTLLERMRAETMSSPTSDLIADAYRQTLNTA